MLTRTECNLLRGLAILGIALHNFCHWLGPAVKENEYQFMGNNVSGICHAIMSPDGMLPINLLSFFGHYGVPVFLFLSAYGLTLKYEDAPSTPPRLRFIGYHWLKLFRMMIVGYVAFTMIDYMTPHPYHYTVGNIIGQLLMIDNVYPNPDEAIWPGPYWFFGLMFQLYIVYRLLMFRRHWAWTAVLMVACMALQLTFQPDGDGINSYRYNFMGGMLPFGLGLLYARYWRRPTSTATQLTILLASIVLIWLTSLSFVLWTFTPLFAITGSIAFVKVFSALANSRMPVLSQASGVIVGALSFCGTISAPLFVCHPITRKIFIPISRMGDIYAGLMLYIVASLALAWLFSVLFKQIPKPKKI